MHSVFTNPLLLLAIYALVRSGDLTISHAIARDVIRAVVYGIVGILLLVFVVLSLFGFI